VAELERAFASERTLKIIAYRKKHGLPVGHRPPMGWKIVGTRAKEVEFPKQTDGKRLVKEWRTSRSPNALSASASRMNVITRSSPDKTQPQTRAS
jgi:hypothetical protein